MTEENVAEQSAHLAIWPFAGMVPVVEIVVHHSPLLLVAYYQRRGVHMMTHHAGRVTAAVVHAGVL
jgi:hypothetical protein